MEKNLFLVRHGETEFNRLGIIQGSSVDSSLNDTGRMQAALFYEHYRDYGFDFVYTSALKRTYESVRNFIEQDRIPHRTLAELNEIHWGTLENSRPEPDWIRIYQDTIAAWQQGRLDLNIANGENPLQVQARLKNAITELHQNTAGNILLCMHGRALKIMLCTLTGIPLTDMERFSHSNLCLYHLVYTGDQWHIRTGNSTEHLLKNQTG